MRDSLHIDPEDLALHAMHLLPATEAAAIDEHIRWCSLCRAEFEAAQNDLVAVALSAEPVAPPPQARERLLRQISREKRVIPIDRAATENAPAPVRKSGSVLPWMGWAVAAGAVLSAGHLYQNQGQLQDTIDRQSAQMGAQTAQMAALSADAAKGHAVMDALTDTSAMRVTLNVTAAAKPIPQGRATYVPEKGTLIFTASNLNPLPSAKVYELWVIPANGTSPIPAGTFQPDGRGYASVVLPNIPKGVPAKAFGVTIEAEGGAATPTMPIVLVGA